MSSSFITKARIPHGICLLKGDVFIKRATVFTTKKIYFNWLEIFTELNWHKNFTLHNKQSQFFDLY